MDKSKTTPLHLAAREGHRSVVEALLAAGAQLGARDASGKGALELAILNGHRSVRRYRGPQLLWYTLGWRYRGPQLLRYTLGPVLFVHWNPYFEGWRNFLPAI